jgi:hypothetical protein
MEGKRRESASNDGLGENHDDQHVAPQLYEARRVSFFTTSIQCFRFPRLELYIFASRESNRCQDVIFFTVPSDSMSVIFSPAWIHPSITV